MDRFPGIDYYNRSRVYSIKQRAIGTVCAIACLLASLAGSAQTKPDFRVGPLWRPIEQLQADPEWRIYAAVVTHDHKTLKALLDGGDSPNGNEHNNRLPLITACQVGDLESVRILVNAGAKIDLFDYDVNPLIEASGSREIEIVRYLLAHGAQINVRRISNGETPLFLALRVRSFDILTLLIHAGADINLRNKGGDTPLMLASFNSASENDYEMVQFLKANGANFNSPDEELLYAASRGDVGLIQQLLAAGAKVNQSYEDGVTPLMAAAINGQTAAVKALIAAGANLTALDIGEGDTPLMYAIQSGHKSTIFALLDAGADPTVTDLGGDNALHRAAVYLDDPDLVHLLIRLGVPAGNGNKINVTPLMYATNGRIQTVKILLDAHVLVNVQENYGGHTALMDAAISGQPDIITLLLRAGADPSIKDKTGKTALDWAIQQGQQAAIEILRKLPPASP
jgi:ankyrin repeat protein